MNISVCLATFNGERYIEEQLASILCQIEENDEIIVSDDSSTDRTIDIIKNVNDKRIKIYKNELEKGYSKNFENAINHAKGKFIFLCDQDDVWMPNKVERMMIKLKKVDMVISDAEIVDSDLNRIRPSHFNYRRVKNGFIINLLKTRYIGACMAFNRKILKKAIPFPGKQRYCAHDYWLTLISEFYYKVELERTPLIKYRRHDFNVSSGGEQSNKPIVEKIRVRVYSFCCLILRVFK